jgi:class 3 adenylate cyclase
MNTEFCFGNFELLPDPGTGQPMAVRVRGDLEDIRFDEDDQRFCDFLTLVAASASKVPGFERVPKGKYFSDLDRLVADRKSTGTRLYFQERNPTRVLADQVNVPTGTKTCSFWRLCDAVAVPEDEPVRNPGVGARSCAILVSGRLQKLIDSVCTDEAADVRRLSTLTFERTFIYVDVSDFTRYPSGQQALVINSLIQLTRDLTLWSSEGRASLNSIEASLCIGDGYIFVGRDALQGTVFAAYLAHLIEMRIARGELPVEFHFRIGVHVGKVYQFWDWGRGDDGAWNFVGDGINHAQRVLGVIGKDTDDVVFVSAAVRQKIHAVFDDVKLRPMLLAAMQNRGRRADKHGRLQRVYELNHTDVAHWMLPQFLTQESPEPPQRWDVGKPIWNQFNKSRHREA